MRTFAQTWPQFGQAQLAQTEIFNNQSDIIGQDQLAQLPWYHHITILDKVKDAEQRIFYIRKTIENGWSRDVMVHQIETSLYQRAGKAITNFKHTLSAIQSDLAQQAIKNPYVFDFISFTEEMRESELEKGLVQHMKKFLLELGKGFAWVGSQKNLIVGGDDFFLDLLFFNYHMNCFVVFELKVGEFKSEFAGKLNFYVNSIDAQLKLEHHNATVGILLCKTPNETVVKYSLQGIDSPIGVSSYQFEKAFSQKMQAELPTVEELEKEIEQGYDELKKPSEKKLDKLKAMLQKKKKPEVKAKKSKEYSMEIFEKIAGALYVKMVNTYQKELDSLFQENEISIYIDNYGFPNLNEAKAHLSKDSLHGSDQFRLEFRSNGFKRAGMKAFNCWTGLQIQMHDYKYTIALLSNYPPVLLEKLYHEKLTQVEEDELVEKWIEMLLDEITRNVAIISGE